MMSWLDRGNALQNALKRHPIAHLQSQGIVILLGVFLSPKYGLYFAFAIAVM